MAICLVDPDDYIVKLLAAEAEIHELLALGSDETVEGTVDVCTGHFSRGQVCFDDGPVDHDQGASWESRVAKKLSRTSQS
jgi:hypothetical protein